MATTNASPGSVKSVLIGKETTWGTAVSATKDVGLTQGINDITNREVIQSSGLGAVEVQKITTGSVTTAGSMVIQLQHGRVFEYLVGAESEGSSGSDFKHTFTIADVPPSFSLESGENAASETKLIYEGCLAIGAELSIILNGVLTLRFDFAGEIPRSTNTASAPVLDNLPVFPQALVDIKLNTVSATMVQSASITFIKTFIPVHGMKSNLAQAAFTTDLKFEFKAVLGFTGVTLQELGIGGTDPPGTADPTGIEFEINADNGTAYGSGQRNIQCVLENCQFTKTEKISAIGAVTFLDLAGNGTLKTLISVDDITGLN